MESRRSTIVSLFLLLAVALAMFADVLFAGGTRVVGHPGSDMFLQYFAWREFGFRELAKGNLALWNPYILAAHPISVDCKELCSIRLTGSSCFCPCLSPSTGPRR